MYDIIVIGAGPAGLTAAIYGRRAGKSVLVLEKSTFGGQMTYSPKIENYPAFSSVSGNELADLMVAQALELGVEIELAEATGISHDAETRSFTIPTTDGEYTCRAVVLATGARHRRLGIEGEEALIGHGISFCAVCDGAFYASSDVAVAGGGNSAVVEAALLADTAKSVTLIQNLSFLTAEATAASALLARPNVRVIYDTVIDGYIASPDGNLTGLRLRPAGSDEGKAEISTLDIDGLFIAVGLEPENRAFVGTVSLDDRGYIMGGDNCDAGTPGVFVAGDCRVKSVRQIATAVGDGAVAGLAAAAYADAVRD